MTELTTTEPTARFLRACRGLPVDCTPIWLMRQAGRYMAEYRALREKHTMLELINTPDLAAQVTLQPFSRFDFDAAIIFADILPILMGLGLDLDFEPGVGPQIYNPLTTTIDIDRLGTPPSEVMLGSTLEAVGLVKAELASQNIPLIGFAGAPFTLASYAIEGGGSKNYVKTKSLMYAEPAAWKRLMTKLVTVVGDYLLKQVQAGADALQIFDSWSGVMSQYDYERYIQPYNQTLYALLKRVDVPVINFSTNTSAYLETVAACGGDVMSVDWRLPLDVAWDKIGPDRAIQGNLDPVTLFAPWRELQPHVDLILDQAAGRPGHIFNLGHGILPQTPLDNVKRLVDYVHERTGG